MLTEEIGAIQQIEPVNTAHIPCLSIIGLPVHMVQIPEVISLMTDWVCIDRQRCRWIVVADMHAAIEAHQCTEFRRMLDQADLIVPDGIGLVRVAQCKGAAIQSRVAGADLMKAFFARTKGMDISHFFLGDTEETLRRLKANLERNYAGITIAGTYSPPFRALTADEDEALLELINGARPDVLWVALGLPKQERWIFQHRHRLNVPLVLGVGAALKFLAGTVKRAPDAVGHLGLEWLWRFAHEPRRLWRRVLIDAPQFVGLAGLDVTGLRKFS
jgi:N-acetylglucosaminyldiphosphoundecaprenol N-acetyl-beta-D-mannosaminyltransferase